MSTSLNNARFPHEVPAPPEADACALAGLPEDVRVGYRYLDHTADVQLHAFGDTPQEAFEAAGIGMFRFMSPNAAAIKVEESVMLEAEGQDDATLLFNFLNELLGMFGTRQLIPVAVRVVVLERQRGNAAKEIAPRFFVRCVCDGEKWDYDRHAQGTEVKAITKHGIRLGIEEEDMRWHAFVILDI